MAPGFHGAPAGRAGTFADRGVIHSAGPGVFTGVS